MTIVDVSVLPSKRNLAKNRNPNLSVSGTVIQRIKSLSGNQYSNKINDVVVVYTFPPPHTFEREVRCAYH